MIRMYRNDVSDETKQKQSLAHQGRKQSEATKQKISQSLSKYWAGLPFKPNDNDSIGREAFSYED